VTLLQNLADEGRAGELDDGVPTAGISYYLAAPEIIRQFLKKWKYSNLFFNVEHFLHLVLSELHLS
jgi:hypothetical protein